MGLIHTRAKKKRDRAEAGLLREQERQLAAQRHASEPVWRQPTVGSLIREAMRRRESPR
jgi:hypothetical protein